MALGIHIDKYIRKRLLLRFYRDSAWMKTVRACQEEILSSSPHPYYGAAYRDAEINYWLHIPKWMYGLRRLRWLRRFRGARQVLDIGCAYGTLAIYAKKIFGCELYCTDFMDEYLSPELAKKHGINFAVNNIERDPFPWRERFDVIIFTEILEHLNFSPVPTLEKIRGLLAPGGKVFLTTPDASEWGRVTKYYQALSDIPMPGAALPVVDDHIWQYSKDELLDVVGRSGFRVDRFGYAPGAAARHFNLQLSAK